MQKPMSPNNPLTPEELVATAALRSPTSALWHQYELTNRPFLPPMFFPVDVREIRPVGTLDDFQNGLAQAILNLVLARDVAGTAIGLYMYGTSFARLTLVNKYSALDKKLAHELVILIEDKAIGKEPRAVSPEHFLVSDFRPHMPWHLYDSTTKTLDPKGVAVFDAYNKRAIFVGMGHDVPQDHREPVPTPFRPSKIFLKKAKLDQLAPPKSANGSTETRPPRWINLRARIAALQLMKTDILRVSPSDMDVMIDSSIRQCGKRNWDPSGLNWTMS